MSDQTGSTSGSPKGGAGGPAARGRLAAPDESDGTDEWDERDGIGEMDEAEAAEAAEAAQEAAGLGLEEPEADTAEQRAELLQQRDDRITARPADQATEADPADVAEQHRTVAHDEDDYR
ncbi:hypothetical protein [Streptomyces sp. NBC_00448]|uniref:hypothetical protein n=1 Tax=Streptomyces sp. NBC_00448 TaxID=2903652 RepID=UPI002E211137